MADEMSARFTHHGRYRRRRGGSRSSASTARSIPGSKGEEEEHDPHAG